MQSISLTETENLSFSGIHPYLDDIQASSTGPAHVDGDGFDQCTLREVLNLLGHSGTEEQGLSLSLDREIINYRTWCLVASKSQGYITKAQFS